MHIAWHHFTPWQSLAGGALIGLAAVVLAWCNGRIAGISGIVAGLLVPRRGDSAWRVSFVLGLLCAPLLFALYRTLPVVDIGASAVDLVLAGLLVGVGTRYGSGCTSGHGVCGLSRLSPRSLVATMCFMFTGFVTTWLLRHALAG